MPPATRAQPMIAGTPSRMKRSFSRKRPAHPSLVETHNRSLIVFVTVCAQHRRKLLAHSDAARVIVEAWQAADHWLVGRYVILPDHLHLFCSPASQDSLPVTRWIAFWKSLAARRWPREVQRPIWQADTWDTQLRRGQSYAAKWEYVRNNPVRHRLVGRPEDWPFQGELNELFWHDA